MVQVSHHDPFLRYIRKVPHLSFSHHWSWQHLQCLPLVSSQASTKAWLRWQSWLTAHHAYRRRLTRFVSVSIYTRSMSIMVCDSTTIFGYQCPYSAIIPRKTTDAVNPIQTTFMIYLLTFFFISMCPSSERINLLYLDRLLGIIWFIGIWARSFIFVVCVCFVPKHIRYSGGSCMSRMEMG